MTARTPDFSAESLPAPGTADSTGLYHAPTPTAPVRFSTTVPGSKSMTNRALILAALATGESTLTGVLRSRDTNLMIDALRTLGTGIADTAPRHGTADTTVKVTPQPLHGGAIDCGLAGTIMRFIPPLAALAEGRTFIDGDAQARLRPMTTLTGALRDLGVQITGDTLPLQIDSDGTLDGGTVTIDASASSQFVSGLLLSAARFEQGVHIIHSGAPVPSQPHIDMTVAMLQRAGVEVTRPNQNEWIVHPGPIRPINWVIEPDLSNATPFLAAAAVTGGEVRVANWPQHTTQAGDAIRQILSHMGCDVSFVPAHTGGGVDLIVTGPDTLRGIDIDLHDIGELTPTVAALAAVAEGRSVLRGIAHLRGHETDRLAALETELTKVGATVTQTSDGLVIVPGALTPARWASYHDHRMATAGAIIGLKVPGLHVENIHTTAKTMPGFSTRWTDVIASSEQGGQAD